MKTANIRDILAFTGSGKKCVVLRGVSGSGKSFIAKMIAADALAASRPVKIHSADNFFVNPISLAYEFNPSKLGEAHATCLKSFLLNIQVVGNGICVVDNTNTTVAEFAPYVAFASAFGWETMIVTVRTDWRVAAERNTHGVPAAGVEAQAKRITQNDPLVPPFWDMRDFVS